MSREHPQNAENRGREEADESHLADIEDGSGCTEIWEQLSERRAANAETPEADD